MSFCLTPSLARPAADLPAPLAPVLHYHVWRRDVCRNQYHTGACWCATGVLCVRVCGCVCVCVMYDGMCQKFTSARLTGCVKMLLSQISDGFIAKSSDTTTIYPGSHIYSDKENNNTFLHPKCTIRNRTAEQVKRYCDAML